MFHLVETLADSPVWLGLCGFGVIVMPILGIQFVYEQKKKKRDGA
jgi:hypothetical protein